MWGKRIKMEPRAENEPKFDPKNKTDRRIMMTVLISCLILSVIIVGLVLVYIFLM
jgi:hypothetical protein